MRLSDYGLTLAYWDGTEWNIMLANSITFQTLQALPYFTGVNIEIMYAGIQVGKVWKTKKYHLTPRTGWQDEFQTLEIELYLVPRNLQSMVANQLRQFFKQADIGITNWAQSTLEDAGK